MCLFAVSGAVSDDLEAFGGQVDGNGRKIDKNEHGVLEIASGVMSAIDML